MIKVPRVKTARELLGNLGGVKRLPKLSAKVKLMAEGGEVEEDFPEPSAVRGSRAKNVFESAEMGSSKSMGMALSSLGEMKGEKGRKGGGDTARAQLDDVLRQLKLKEQGIKDVARGLGKNTFGAPTLEQPLLTKAALTRRSFAEGGDVSRETSDDDVKFRSMRLPGTENLPGENVRENVLQLIKGMDDKAVIATATRLSGVPFETPTQARIALEKLVGEVGISAGVLGQGRSLPDRFAGYTVGAGMPLLGGRLQGQVDFPVNQKPVGNVTFIKRFEEGGDVSRETMSPEEQPVTEESSASKALKRLMGPVREGARGYFGLEPGDPANPTEAYRTMQALGNMSGAGAPGAIAAGVAGLGSRIIPAAKRLLLMPCSDMKCETPAAAKDLYKGVFYQTYNRQVKPGAEPHMMILSAKHGFVTPKQMLEPYNQKMTPQQAEELVSTVKKSLEAVEWPTGIEEVMLVGGKHYQRVMNAAVDELKAQGKIPEDVVVRATKGEIGQQRQQLGEYLRGIPSSEQGSVDDFIVQKMRDGGEVSSPEEQPVTEESSASKALKRLIEPVREGARGFLGMEPSDPTNPTEAYKALQAIGNMPGPVMAKGAAKAAMQVPGLLEGVATSIFIGPRAAQWNKAAHKTAVEMEKAGASPQEIWSATMNFRAPDGKWRQEISDVPAALKQGPDQGPLEAFVSHPELYKNYPDLQRLEVTKDVSRPTSGYVTADDSLILGQRGGRDVSEALHEIQHAIQMREMFAGGGNPTMAFNNKEAFDILQRKRKEISTPHTLEEYSRIAWQTETPTPEVRSAYRVYLEWMKSPEALQKAERQAQQAAADEYYMRLHGEAEARAVQSRRPLDVEQRRQTFPLESYTRNGQVIPPEDLIIKRKEGGSVNKHDAFIKAKS